MVRLAIGWMAVRRARLAAERERNILWYGLLGGASLRELSGV